MRKLRPRNFVAFAQAHTTSKWWTLGLKPKVSGSRIHIFLPKPLRFIPQVKRSSWKILEQERRDLINSHGRKINSRGQVQTLVQVREKGYSFIPQAQQGDGEPARPGPKQIIRQEGLRFQALRVSLLTNRNPISAPFTECSLWGSHFVFVTSSSPPNTL